MTVERQAVDVGRAWQQRYKVSAGRRLHAVRPKTDDENPRRDLGAAESRWRTVCLGQPATREYRGWTSAVTCEDCQRELARRGETDGV